MDNNVFPTNDVTVEFLTQFSTPELTPYFLEVLNSHSKHLSVQLLPLILTKLARSLGALEPFLQSILNESLRCVSEPQLIFRTDSFTAKILRELTHLMVGQGLMVTLAPILHSLSHERLSTRQLSQKSLQLLDFVYSYDYPIDFRAVCNLIQKAIGSRLPGSQRQGLSGVFFLRYLCPTILIWKPSCDSPIGPHYASNSLEMVKLIQTLANASTPPPGEIKPDEKKIFSTLNQRKMTEFFTNLCHLYPDMSYLDASAFHHALSEKIYLPEEAGSPEADSIYLMNSLLKWGPDVSNRVTRAFEENRVSSQTRDRWITLFHQVSSMGVKSEPASSSDSPPPKPPLPPELIRPSQTDPCVDQSSLLEGSAQSIDLPEWLSLQSVHLESVPDQIRWVCPSLDEIYSWPPQRVSTWLVVNELDDLLASFGDVNGQHLIEGCFTFPNLEPDLAQRFNIAYEQLERGSVDLFDRQSFASADQQIFALQTTLVKMSNLVEYLSPSSSASLPVGLPSSTTADQIISTTTRYPLEPVLE